jgi:hypothetical protein
MAITSAKVSGVANVNPLQTPSMRRLAMIVGGGALLLTLLFVLTDQPQSAPNRSSVSSSQKVKVAALLPSVSQPPKIDSYSSLMRRDLFKPLITTATGGSFAGLAPAKIEGLGALPKAKLAGPLGGWSYIGSVSIDGEAFALLQEASSGNSGYYKVGETVNGLPIQSIQSGEIVLGQTGQPPVRLAKTSGAVTNAAPSRSNAPGNAQIAQNGSAPNPADGAAAATGDAANQASANTPDNSQQANFGRRRGGRGGFNRGGGGGFNRGGFNRGGFNRGGGNGGGQSAAPNSGG